MRLRFLWLVPLLTAPLTGCATLWLVGEATDLNWSTSSYEEVKPGAEKEQSAWVKTRYVPPAPPPEVPFVEEATETEAPQPEIVEPPSATAPPVLVDDAPRVPAGTLALTCELKERPVKEHVTAHDFQYESAWKPLTAFMFVAEASIATISLLSLRNTDDGGNRNLALGMSIGLGLDAIGTAVLFFHPQEEHVRTFDRPGTWATVDQRCPTDLSVRVAHTEVRVTEDGGLPYEVGREALMSMAEPGGAFALRWRNDALRVRPSAQDRCEWAQAQGVPDPRAFCAPPKPLDAPLLEFRAPSTEPYVLTEKRAEAAATVTW